jgi:multisubunit Na+/H+ antiporter MnhE subunit
VIAIVLRVAGLALVYLLVLTSTAPGDVLVGGLVAIVLVLVAGAHGPRRSPAGWVRWLASLTWLMIVTAWNMVVGTVRVVRFCLAGTGSPGFVEVPRGDRSRHGIALWGVLTGEAPDEYPVAVDDERHVLIVHHVDARDPDAIRARHESARDRYERDVVP